MTRAQIHQRFADTFAPGQTAPMPLEDLAQIEALLGITFPTSFVEFATTYGALDTPSTLNLVTGLDENDEEHPPPGASFDIQAFLVAEDITGTTQEYQEAGMQDWLVAIAYDCMGNVFGFRHGLTSADARPDDAPLYVFDHDWCAIKEEAPSFDHWLNSFLLMKQWVTENQ